MQKKIIWSAIISAMMIGIFFAGELFGMHRKKDDNQKVCTSETIAIVNLDKGMEQDGEIVNYAAVLGGLPDDNFVFTGLEDAKIGIVSDKFAAYIVLPYSFSEDICSINSHLRRSQIQYKINPRLKQSLQEQVQGDIQFYLQNIGDNASYMYVDAILDEFHQAQDDAGQVIANDTSDYQMVTGIEGKNLMVPVEYPELVHMDETFSSVDVNKEFEAVTENISEIEKELNEGKNRAESAFGQLENGGKEAVDSGEKFLEYVGTVSIAADQNGETVYSAGIEAVENYAGEYEEANNNCQEKILRLLGEADEEEGQRDPQPDAEDLGNIIFILQKTLAKEKEEISIMKESCQSMRDTISGNDLPADLVMQDSIQRYSKGEESDSNEKISVSGNEPEYEGERETEENYLSVSGNSPEYEPIKKENIQKTAEALAELEKQIENYEKLLTENEANLEIVKKNTDTIREDMQQYNAIDGTELAELIQTGIVEPIEKKIDSEEIEIEKRVETMRDDTDAYLKELEEYDPLDYIDDESIQNQISLMREETSKIQDGVDETNRKCIEYADGVFNMAEDNVDSLQEQMDMAYQKTEKNWSQTLSETVKAKEEWHKENLQLLESLTRKLLYSRKGTIANQQMYEFIINPIQIERVY